MNLSILNVGDREMIQSNDIRSHVLSEISMGDTFHILVDGELVAVVDDEEEALALYDVIRSVIGIVTKNHKIIEDRYVPID